MVERVVKCKNRNTGVVSGVLVSAFVNKTKFEES